MDEEFTGETVVLLSRKNPDDYLEITWAAHDFGNKGCKPTYEQIKAYVKEKYGYNVTHLNIAQAKDKCGLKERENYNLCSQWGRF